MVTVCVLLLIKLVKHVLLVLAFVCLTLALSVSALWDTGVRWESFPDSVRSCFPEPITTRRSPGTQKWYISYYDKVDFSVIKHALTKGIVLAVLDRLIQL